MINVTQTYLPNKEKYKQYVDEIYQNSWVTNNGILVKKLEKRLEDFLGVKNLVLVANGTMALEIAYRTLDIKGFALTTPFSFVATTSSLVTNDISPIFVDIDPYTLNIDPDRIEELITPHTEAIVPVHTFGNGCDIDKIQAISQKHNLKVIYDAAHAFGVDYKGQSILNYGDISTLSFHATKLFHTIEGGALVINNDELVTKAKYLINFGIENEESIPYLGTNAKMNEFEAAMGLCMLDEMEIVTAQRKKVYEHYEEQLDGLVRYQYKNKDTNNNYSYFPVILESEVQLKKVKNALMDKNIFPRRYFYPSLDTLDYIEPKQYAVNSRDISKRILALPIFVELEKVDQDKIIKIVKESL